MRLRVLSWNIHKGIGGLDRRYRLERIAHVIRRLKPDIALLQEVDHGAKRSEFHQQSEELSTLCGMPHSAVGLNHFLRSGGAYGNVTLSRMPILSSENIDLTLPLKKRRAALFTTLGLAEGQRLHVFNFHLGLVAFEQRFQIKRILVCDQLHRSGAEPVLLGGDSNDWRGALCKRLLEPQGFHEVSRSAKNGQLTPTFPAFKPVLALDRVYFRGLTLAGLAEADWRVLNFASDHRPLVADFAPLLRD